MRSSALAFAVLLTSAPAFSQAVTGRGAIWHDRGIASALDLSTGQPMGHSVRSCVIGMRLAQEIGLPQEAQSDLYYALLMKDAGCSSSSSSPSAITPRRSAPITID